MQPRAGEPYAALGRPTVGRNRAEGDQGLPGGGHRPGGRGVGQGEPGGVRVAPAGHLEGERGEVGERDLGGGEAGGAGVLGLVPAAVDGAGGLAARAAGALAGGGERGAHGDQGGEAPGVVGARLPGEPGVDHDPHAGHGEGGFGDGGGEDDATPRRRGERRVLDGLRRAPVQLEHLGRDPGQLPGDPGDLADAGQEAEHVPVPLGEGPPDHRRDVVEQREVHPGAVRGPDGARRRRPHHLDRVRDAVRLDHRRVVQEFGPGRGVGGGGGADDPQFGPQGGADVEQERERGVGVQVPFVALVEHDDVDAGQFLVALEALQQDAGGDHLDHGLRADAPLAAHGVPDLAAHGGAEQPGHPPGGGPDGEPARFGDQHPACGPAVGEQPGQGERHQGGLAGAGRRGEDGGARSVQRRVQRGQGGADGQVVPGGVRQAGSAPLGDEDRGAGDEPPAQR